MCTNCRGIVDGKEEVIQGWPQLAVAFASSRSHHTRRRARDGRPRREIRDFSLLFPYFTLGVVQSSVALVPPVHARIHL
ncbi:hypothetical protein IQ07DRAFT_93190 [Pyrenochaeta sp. DS3sAY3a]|nr:hypothetical protein IQ07DRAFT_93190 [Pyrenochaeta sp. DS3sAY3a]